MKKIILTILLAIAGLSAQARGYHYHDHHYRSWYYPAISFYYGGSPYYSPWYSYSYSYYPAYGGSYAYHPTYGYDYGYSRPNYAVNGTLLGALTGGLIGNSIHHQGWEGAGIGAAAGLLLGSLAEHNARTYERTYYAAPTVSYVRPNHIANAPTVGDPPTVPAAARVQNTTTTYKPASSMSGANSLFGR